jgi:S-DNA-T family DNA segregation ATPase FtsK/SpoIIIE
VNKGDKELEQVGNYMLAFLKGLYSFFKNVFYGIRNLKDKKSRIYGLGIIAALGIGLFLLRENIWTYIPKDNKKLQIAKYAIYGTPGFPLIYLYFLGNEHSKFKDSFDEIFESIGFYGKGKRKNRSADGKLVESKDYPRFMGTVKEGSITTYSFYSNININDWVGRGDDLQNALDCNILKIENAKTTKKVVKVYTVPSDMTIPEMIYWNDDLLIEDKEDKFELILGENMLEKIKIDLNKLPHVLVAGETGSGKSVILRLLLWQGILKAARMFMIDFKGGVEFGLDYEQFGEVITEKQRALEVLKDLTRENQARLKLFREMRVKNLAQYNIKAEEKGFKKLCRIMMFIDELAEMTDKTGASKEAKELMSQIEKEQSTLARLSRATGINLIIGIQRPDAKVITGQIKNNIPVRICGRFADKAASEIVLGNTRATNLPEIKGRFLFKVGADTVEFQSYYFNDDTMLRKVDIQTGGMLTKDDDIPEKRDTEKKADGKGEGVKASIEFATQEVPREDTDIENEETKINYEVWTAEDVTDWEDVEEVEILDVDPF